MNTEAELGTRTDSPTAPDHCHGLRSSFRNLPHDDFGAVNGIARAHHAWLVNEAEPERANADVAFAGAAHTVLLAFWGQSTNPRNFEVAYEKTLAEFPRQSKNRWRRLGEHIAKEVLAARQRWFYTTASGQSGLLVLGEARAAGIVRLESVQAPARGVTRCAGLVLLFTAETLLLAAPEVKK